MSQADSKQAVEQVRGPHSWDAVRTEKLRRARALLQDPDYPSKKTLEAVADLLARNLAKDGAKE